MQGTTPAGAYSPGIIAEGRFLYVSGQGPLVDGAVHAGLDRGRDAPHAREHRAHPRQAGAGFGDVVRCGVFLADINDFAAMNEVYATFFPDPKPARTTVQVAALPGGIKVEIDCVVVLP